MPPNFEKLLFDLKIPRNFILQYHHINDPITIIRKEVEPSLRRCGKISFIGIQSLPERGYQDLSPEYHHEPNKQYSRTGDFSRQPILLPILQNGRLARDEENVVTKISRQLYPSGTSAFARL